MQMKLIINTFMTLAMLGVAYWAIQTIVLSPDAAPIGGNPDPNIDAYRGEIDTFREAR